MASNSDGTPGSTTSTGITRQIADITSSTGHGTSSHGSRNRRGNRRNIHRGNTNTTGIIGRARFEGREPSLKGYIYDFTGKRNPE